MAAYALHQRTWFLRWFASPKKPSTRLRNRSGLLRSWRRFRPDVRLGVSPDGNCNAIPRVFIMRVAAADRDRTGEHVTIVDVPAFLTGIGRSAAGESGHPSSNCGIEGVGKPSYSLGSKIGAESARGGTLGPPEAIPWARPANKKRRHWRQTTKGTFMTRKGAAMAVGSCQPCCSMAPAFLP